ncbi:hypothetical protein [Cyanobium gracile]|uniref:Uncharacterized protein n=1 Tax=Cyanobium gracile (strain ATCC 27147 / PCC 6307) TaxID=292564 RepID=K9P9C9_CYAGP|nr:hypothetical protein [Cyanobium gracile]AFY29987.1 hypothetical protein Cyagr_2895 [Cyanobium gracile PCC 6307]
MRSSEPDTDPDSTGDGLAPLPLPEGPLTMARLVALEPAALRRLLTTGLRAGLTEAELDAGCAAAAAPGQEPADLRARLQERGWLGWDPDRQRWRTRLGAPTAGAPPQG